MSKNDSTLYDDQRHGFICKLVLRQNNRPCIAEMNDGIESCQSYYVKSW